MNAMRTMLFCPGDNPKMYSTAPAFRPDAILFDLEDAVALSEKDGARDLLCQAVKSMPFGNSLVFARVNALSTEFCRKDLLALVQAGVRYIRLAMCQGPEDVILAGEILADGEKLAAIPEGTVKLQCSIETPKGVLNARESVAASDRVISLSFGAEDYTRCMGGNRSKGGLELTYPRTYLPVVAAEAGISAIDTVWTDVTDTEGFREEVKTAKALGFTGKSCIHPSQIAIVHEIFTPSEQEIIHARRVVEAATAAREKSVGVFSLDGKMIDEPVIRKALHVLNQIGEGREAHGFY